MTADDQAGSEELTIEELDLVVGGAVGGFSKTNREEAAKHAGTGDADISLNEGSATGVVVKEEGQKRG